MRLKQGLLALFSLVLAESASYSHEIIRCVSSTQPPIWVVREQRRAFGQKLDCVYGNIHTRFNCAPSLGGAAYYSAEGDLNLNIQKSKTTPSHSIYGEIDDEHGLYFSARDEQDQEEWRFQVDPLTGKGIFAREKPEFMVNNYQCDFRRPLPLKR